MRYVVIMMISALFAGGAGAQSPAAPALARPAVTFIPFEDLSPGAGEALPPVPGAQFNVEAPMPWLADGIPAALDFTLERAAAVNILPRADLALALKKQNIDLTATTGVGEIAETSRRAGVTHLVGGSFAKGKTDLTLTVKVWALEGLTAEDLAAIKDAATELAGIAQEIKDLTFQKQDVAADPALPAEEKNARLAELESRVEALNARTAEVKATEIDSRGLVPEEKSFAGDVRDLFGLVENAAAFVIASAAGETKTIMPRRPTDNREAFMWFARGASRLYTGEQISFYLRATEADPNMAEAYLKLADAYRLEKNYDVAITTYEKARALADYYPSAPTGIAAAGRKAEPENAEGAVYMYNEALAIDPAYAPAFDGLGGLYFAAGDYEKARESYGKFIEIWPTNKDGYYALGNTLWLLGKDSPQWKALLQAAIENYSKSLEVDPDFSACHYNIASVYKIFEDVANAIYHYRRYVELEPNSEKRAEIEATIAEWEQKYGPGGGGK